MLPKHILEPNQSKPMDAPVGSGPFKFVRYTPSVSLEIEKNKSYFIPGRPYLDRITLFVIPDDGTSFAALRTGRILLTTIGSRAITPQEAQQVESDPVLSKKITIERYASATAQSLIPKLTIAPWNDVRVRKAVSLALDRQAQVRVAESAIMAGPLNPRTIWGIPLNELEKRPGYRQPKTQDIADAKKLLADAGYTNGLDVSLNCRQGRECEEFAPLVRSDLAKIGVRVTLVPTNGPLVTEMLTKGDFRFTLFRPGAPLLDPDSTFFEQYLTGSNRNYGGFSDKQVDDWTIQQSRTLDLKQRQELVRKIQERILDLEPYPTLFYLDYLRGRWSKLKGFNSLGLYVDENLEYAWLDE